MTSTAVVREWYDDEGWGVVDLPGARGGCWVHHSEVQVEGYRSLRPGEVVELVVERVHQDGFDLRGSRVRPVRRAGDPDQPGYASDLHLSLDVPGVEPVRVVRPDARVPADPTAGMARELAFEAPGLWAGQVTTAPGAVSAWHHHAANQSSLYVVRGVLRLEFEGTAEHLDAVAGDFVHVPAFTVHRESNPTDEPSVAVIARAGYDVPTVGVAHAPAPHDGTGSS